MSLESMMEPTLPDLTDARHNDAAILAGVFDIQNKMGDLSATIRGVLEENVKRTHFLFGNGQKGFVDTTRDDIAEIKSWMRSHDAVCANREKDKNRHLVLVGLVVTMVNLVIQFVIKFWPN